MDPKKQALTPELKQIYDRVMSTQVSGQQAAATTTPSTPQQTATTPPVVPSTPEPTTTLGDLASVTTPPVATPVVPVSSAPVTPPPAPVDNTFLSSTPPRPLADTKPFVFSGKVEKPKEEAHNDTVHAQPATGKKMSSKIIVMLVGVLVVVWGLFWAKFFGLI